jgi:hypothetical protein
VPHIRILRHYIHTPYLVMAGCEAVLVIASVYLGYWIRAQDSVVASPSHVATSIVYASIVMVSMVAMGV